MITVRSKHSELDLQRLVAVVKRTSSVYSLPANYEAMQCLWWTLGLVCASAAGF